MPNTVPNHQINGIFIMTNQKKLPTLKTLNILIVDDYPVIIEACKEILTNLNSEEQKVNIDSAISCDSAIACISAAEKTTPYDLVFLDINIPESSTGKIIDGEDLALLVKKRLPKAKIIIFTGTDESHLINSILKNVDPCGFLVKIDIDASEILMAVNKVLNNTPYYSSTVLRFIRDHVFEDLWGS